MTKKKQITLDANNYYSDKSFLSNSMICRLIENPTLFDLWMKGEYVYPPSSDMIMGSYVHWNWLNHISDGGLISEPMDFVKVLDHDLRSKAGKEYRAEIDALYPNRGWIVESEVKRSDDLINYLISDHFVNDYIGFYKSRYAMVVERAYTSQIQFGEYLIPIKGKLDVSFFDLDGIKKIIDLKTTRSMMMFPKSVRTYGYDRQAKFYSGLTGTDLSNDVFDFLAISKDEIEVKVFTTSSPNFIRQCDNAVNYGLGKYVNYLNGNMYSLKYEAL